MVIKLPVVTLKDDYESYLNGEEVMVTVHLHDNIFEGDHVLVYKDSIPATTSIPVPREKQSKYIGVEGIVTKLVNRAYEHESIDDKMQTIIVKIL